MRMAWKVVLLAVLLKIQVCCGQLSVANMSAANISQSAITLHPSLHEILMVGHKSVIKILCEGVVSNVRLRIHLQKPLALLYPNQLFCFTNESSTPSGGLKQLELLGLLPGNTLMLVDLQDADNNASQIHSLTDAYYITVVERIDVARDAFMYVLSMVKFLVLLMLGFRMHSVAVKEALRRPCALITALLCQVIFMPLVSLGVSLALALPVHSVVCLLVVGCCPTGVLSPVFAVLQQAHVELAMLLTLIETAAAFGAVPGWLFAYGHFLGVAYSQVSFPYIHIAGALGYVIGPILLGVALKRCINAPLKQFDKSIQPVCLLVSLIGVTVSISDLLHLWVHVTWRLLLAGALLPVCGFMVGTIINAIFKQKLPKVKTAGVVTSIQNTLLAKVILQTSYPAEDSSLMAVTIVCTEAMTLAFMVLMYIMHLLLWLVCTHYRVCHDGIGISGIQCSIGERLVKNMVKAGEIKFCNRDRSPMSSTMDNNACGSNSSESLATKVSKVSERNILSQRRSSFNQKTLGSVNRAFSSSFDSLGRTGQVISADQDGQITLNYFVSPDSTPDNNHEGHDKDSISIDYDMLTLSREKELNTGNRPRRNIPTTMDSTTDDDLHGELHESPVESTSQATSICNDNVGLMHNY